MSYGLTVPHTQAPQVYDERDASEDLDARLTQVARLLDQAHRDERRQVRAMIVQTAAQVLCDALRLDYCNRRQAYEELQRFRLTQLRIEGQARLIELDSQTRIRLIKGWLDRFAQASRDMHAIVDNERRSARSTEALADIEAA